MTQQVLTPDGNRASHTRADARQVLFTNQPNLATKTAVVGGTTYAGYAPIGSATDAAVWQIQRIITSGGVTTITWADGDELFDNVWDNYDSLDYS